MLSVKVGPMFSKKTSWLLDTLNDHLLSGHRIIYINSNKDTRTDTFYSTHNDLIKNDAKFEKIKVKFLNEVSVENYDVIGIDEGQWFDDIYENVKKWLSLNKIIYCVGLDGNYKAETIGHLNQLIPISDFFEKKNSICSICAREGHIKNAPFTKYLQDNEISDPNYTIDTGKNYIPVCRKHF